MQSPESLSNPIPSKGIFDEHTTGIVSSEHNLIFVFALYANETDDPVRENIYQGLDLEGAYKFIKSFYPDADKFGYSTVQTGIPLEEVFGLDYKDYGEEVIRS